MKSFVSALGMATAAFAVVGSANAADLPSRKAAPVEYVRVCSAYGAGFFYIPGTDTCLRVGGRVRAEYLVQQRFNPRGLDVADQYGMRARGRIFLDARNQTSYGTLRTFIRVDTTISNGSYATAQGTNSTGPIFTTTRGGAGATSVGLDRAFIQFGPITAGRSQSFFDFYADTLNYGPIRTTDAVTNLLAYTATFGSGISATISLEDRIEKELSAPGFTAAGQDYPDLIGSLRVTQGWGEAQLSGAVFQRKTAATITSATTTSFDKTGFAIQGGVKFNLPMLAAGDELWLQAAYTEGGISYIGYGGNSGTWGQNSNVGRLLFTNADASVTAAGQVKLTKGYSFVAGFLHYWTPTIRQGIYGSYSKLDYANGIGAVNAIGQDPTEWRAGSNLIWSPVAGLDIGVEVLYAKAQVKTLVAAAGRPGILIKSDDAWQGRLRIQRDF